jgi:hypothetical protein
MNTYKEWLKRARSSLELAKSADNALIYMLFKFPTISILY